MYTQESLKRGFFLRNQESELRKRISKLYCRLTGSTANYNGMPKGNGGDTMAALIAEYLDLQADLRQLEEEHKRVNESTEKDIAGLDEYHKTLLTERYIDLMTWKAMGMKHNQSEDCIRVYVTRYVAKTSGK